MRSFLSVPMDGRWIAIAAFFLFSAALGCDKGTTFRGKPGTRAPANGNVAPASGTPTGINPATGAPYPPGTPGGPNDPTTPGPNGPRDEAVVIEDGVTLGSCKLPDGKTVAPGGTAKAPCDVANGSGESSVRCDAGSLIELGCEVRVCNPGFSMAGSTCRGKMRLCWSECGGAYPHDVGGWRTPNNDVSSQAFGKQCGGTMEYLEGDSYKNLRLCSAVAPPAADVTHCVGKCGGPFPSLQGGMRDSNTVEGHGFSENCAGTIHNSGRNKDDTSQFLLCGKDANASVRICVGKCGGTHPHAVGAWVDSSNVEDIAFGDGCTSEASNRGGGNKFAYYCSMVAPD